MSNSRERILMIAVCGLAVIMGFKWMIDRTFLEPLRRQNLQATALQQEIEGKENQKELLFEASDKLARWEEMSLPSYDGLAESLYQKFLVELSNEYLDGGEVQLRDEPQTPFFKPVSFRITGTVELKNLTELLREFHEPQILHQVRHLEVRRLTDSDDELGIALDVEALSINTAPEFREKLFTDESKSGGVVLTNLTSSDIGKINSVNIFTPYKAPPRIDVVIPPRINEKDHVKFTATIDDGPDIYWTGWLYDRLTNEVKELRKGDTFEIAGVSGRVAELGRYTMTIEAEGKIWNLELGKNLSEMNEIGTIQPVIEEQQKPSSTETTTVTDKDLEPPEPVKQEEGNDNSEGETAKPPEKTE